MAEAPTCQACGVEIPWVGRGRRPQFCDAHKDVRVLRQQRRNAEARGDVEEVRRLSAAMEAQGLARSATKGAEAMAGLPDMLQAAFLAVGLNLQPEDVGVAAEIVGLGSDVDLQHLESLARNYWPKLIAGQKSELDRLLDGALKIQTLRAVAGIGVAESAQAVSKLAQTASVVASHSGGALSDHVKVEWVEAAA